MSLGLAVLEMGEDCAVIPGMSSKSHELRKAKNARLQDFLGFSAGAVGFALGGTFALQAVPWDVRRTLASC